VAKCGVLGGLCVANMSLGGKSSALNTAVNAAVSAGVVMVVAANKDACSYSPGSATSTITVGSTTNTDTDARSSFSNKGKCVDVYAPGSGITSSWISSPVATRVLSGTSMASPRKFSMFCC
jgi:serine protease